MSNPFDYDLYDELRKPLTKYQALKLAAILMSSPSIELDEEDGKYAENHIEELFSVGEQILERDASLIKEILQADKQLAYDEIMTERQQD